MAAIVAVPFVPTPARVSLNPYIGATGLVFHPNAFAFTMAPLDVTKQFGVEFDWDSCGCHRERRANVTHHFACPDHFAERYTRLWIKELN